MIKNRTTQLIFQSFYCAIGLIGIVASLGIFDDIMNPRWDFYVHFTNISNYLCFGTTFAALWQTAKKSEDSYVTTAPFLKFIGVLAILLTFLVFNFLLAGQPDRDPQANWRISSISFHVVLPIMYVFDWILFYEHKKIRWFQPLAAVIFPLLYVAFVFVRAAIVNFNVYKYINCSKYVKYNLFIEKNHFLCYDNIVAVMRRWFDSDNPDFFGKYAFVGSSVRHSVDGIEKTLDKLAYIPMGAVNNDMFTTEGVFYGV